MSFNFGKYTHCDDDECKESRFAEGCDCACSDCSLAEGHAQGYEAARGDLREAFSVLRDLVAAIDNGVLNPPTSASLQKARCSGGHEP